MRSKTTGPGSRVPHPDETKYPWLRMLLEAFHIADEGWKALLAEEEARRNQKVPCRKGCFACCLRGTYPVSPIELAGISWYVSEQLDDPLRSAVLYKLANFAPPDSCPFLTDGACAIHLMRPLACRTFFVFGEPCKLGQDVRRTEEDMAWLSSAEHRNLAQRVSLEILPYYGIVRHNEKVAAFKRGVMLSVTKNMHEISRKTMAARISAHGPHGG